MQGIFEENKQLHYYLISLLFMDFYIHVHIVYTFNYFDGGLTGGNSTLPSAPTDDPPPEASSVSDVMCTEKPTYYNHESSKFHVILEC